MRFLKSLGALVELRRGDGGPHLIDGGNAIIDCRFGPIADVSGLARTLDGRAGIVAQGLFVCLARDVIVAGAAGVRHLRRDDGRPNVTGPTARPE